MVGGGGEHEAVLAAEALLVVRILPGLDMAGDQVVAVLDAGQAAMALHLGDLFPEEALADACLDDREPSGLGDLDVLFDPVDQVFPSLIGEGIREVFAGVVQAEVAAFLAAGACRGAEGVDDHAGELGGDFRQVQLFAAPVRLQRGMLLGEEGGDALQLVLGTEGAGVEIGNVNPPAELGPVLAVLAEFGGLGAVVAVGGDQAAGDHVAVPVGKDHVTGGDIPHILVERVPDGGFTVPATLAFRRP